MTKDLTGRQRQILDAIREHIEETGRTPTIRQVAERFGFAASTVFQHVDALEKKGVVRRIGSPGGRSLEIVGLDPAEAIRAMKKIPVLGRVAAGIPALAEENIEGFIYADNARLKGEDFFALRVKGDSMTGAGIYEKDMLIVRKQNTAREGEIVVALIDDEATVKRFASRKGRPYLIPENPRYAPIPMTPGAVILGKVICVQRMMEEI